MTEEEALTIGDQVVDEFHAIQRECRALRERVVALCDRLTAYSETLRNVEPVSAHAESEAR